ncbi:transglycosylase SLT domain-containing protein [Streptomyces sp. TRM66268-LWL]|uniref:Transglycosylase SLT domain-containing protein n=1 Tax=Streptomyces polyasparticus TaxID=2767826 RepID=A0ABR7SD52_9ACTN|nr:transglycosylase SLT domain-containing protein [Streptomyces polyasparticus]MBC9712527.1 transglycosylase SLT domain-containing protein [Streptomyces polyasparticus]
MSISSIRRIASPKKAVTTALVAASAAGLVFAAAPAQAATVTAAPATAPAAAGSAQAIARQMIPDTAQFNAFSQIVSRESGWNHTATNASSGAYGLVQALPGSKMASAGADWKTNPATQIKWGLDYMNSRYGSPVGAWNFWQQHHWY